MNVSVPKNSGDEEYSIVFPTILAVPPLSGIPVEVIVRVSPISGKIESFTKTSKLFPVVPSSTVNASSLAVGRSLTGSIVIDTIAVLLSSNPSFAL